MNRISKKEFYESITHKYKEFLIEGWEKIFSQMNEDQYFIEDHGKFGIVVKSRFGIEFVDHIHNRTENFTELKNNSFVYIQHKIDLFNEFLLKDKPLMREIQSQLWMIEKPFRPECLLEILEKESSHLTDEEVWCLVTETWTEVEFNSHIRFTWLKLFSLREPINSLKKDLPEEMSVYRGGHHMGFSWTLSEEVGQWFSERFNEDIPLLKMKVNKSDVLFYTNDRHEEEVVLIPNNQWEIEVLQERNI